jgi:aminopeptidase N
MRYLIFILLFASIAYSQMPTIEPGVSHDLAIWRAARYSDIRYKLNLTLEKMSPVLKGTIEIRVNYVASVETEPTAKFIILDWRKIPGHEELSTISNISINGTAKLLSTTPSAEAAATPPNQGGEFKKNTYQQLNDHLIFTEGVRAGENVIKLDFTSPILTSGAAITRYIDKEDGSEYIYSLFVPSDASTAFPVFDQPDLKARFNTSILAPDDWNVISNSLAANVHETEDYKEVSKTPSNDGGTTVTLEKSWVRIWTFSETKPISSYVFAFTAGPWAKFSDADVTGGNATVKERATTQKDGTRVDTRDSARSIYVRKSQAAKFKPHAAEVFHLRDEAIKYLETYFDYKFPWPKYDIVLIPEFPFGGMEHAGETFLRESGVIFPTEPTANDYISRANLIFHETAHQWFGDTVTMRWFDDLWLKEGFAEFMAYKTLEHTMPQYNAWKIFYERIKQSAYATDSTKGTTPIYQEITNLSAAKSAYGNIVYRKAPSFLRQAEHFLGENNFQIAVQAFLKKHQFGNADWKDLVSEFEDVAWYHFGRVGFVMSLRRDADGLPHWVETSNGLAKLSIDQRNQIEKDDREKLRNWADEWIRNRGLPIIRAGYSGQARGLTQPKNSQPIKGFWVVQKNALGDKFLWTQDFDVCYQEQQQKFSFTANLLDNESEPNFGVNVFDTTPSMDWTPGLVFPNCFDHGYGIFLLNSESRRYLLKNIQNEKDDFLRSMMWGALWDSVREAELDPKDYVELVIMNLSTSNAGKKPPEGGTPNTETDETTIQLLLARVGTAMGYYLPDKQRDEIAPRLENMLLDNMQHATTAGQRITFYRAFINAASTPHAREVLKQMLKQAAAGATTGGNPSVNERATVSTNIPLKTYRNHRRRQALRLRGTCRICNSRE